MQTLDPRPRYGPPSMDHADPADPAAAEASGLLTDHRLTAMGLLFETHAGIASTSLTEIEALGIPASAFDVMIRLARSPFHRLRMSELATQTILTNSGLTRLVDRLEATGFVVREPCETDRRGAYAVLTELGQAKVLAVLPSHLRTVERIFTGVLEVDELERFLATLRKLRQVAKPGSDPDVARALVDEDLGPDA